MEACLSSGRGTLLDAKGSVRRWVWIGRGRFCSLISRGFNSHSPTIPKGIQDTATDQRKIYCQLDSNA